MQSSVYINLDDRKAGMLELNKEKINQVIHEASQGSMFYETQLRKETKLKQKVANQLKLLQNFDSQQKKAAKLKMENFIKEANAKQNLDHTIVHIDMDAFFAAVEIRDNPELASKPIAVGSMQMISTSNYIARRYGVRAAMAGFIGKKLCPELVLVPHNFRKYKEAALQTQSIFSIYDPKFSSGGLDEAYLDLTVHLNEKRFFATDSDRTFSFRRVCSCFCHRGPNLNSESTSPTEVPGSESNDCGSVKDDHPVEEELEERNNPRLPDFLANEESSSSCGLDSLVPHLHSESSTGSKVVHISKESTPPEPLVCFCKTTNREIIDGDGIVQNSCEFTTPGCQLAMRRLTNHENSVGGSQVPLFEDGDLDTIDVTFGTSVEEAVQEIRMRVYEKTGLTCSAGIAPTRLLAKICTDLNKPNGQYLLESDKEKIMEFIGKTPINKVNGIGKVTYALLNSLGVQNCGDVWVHREKIGLLYSDIFCRFLASIYIGGSGGGHCTEDDSDSDAEEYGGRKSIGIERTVVHNDSRKQSLRDDGAIYQTCSGLCTTLSLDMISRSLVGQVVAVKMKSSNFRVLTRMKTLVRPTNLASVILAEAWKMVQAELRLAREAAKALPAKVRVKNSPTPSTQLRLKGEVGTTAKNGQPTISVTKDGTGALGDYHESHGFGTGSGKVNPYLYNYYQNYADESLIATKYTKSFDTPHPKFPVPSSTSVSVTNHQDFLSLRLLGVRMCKLENSKVHDTQTKFLQDWMGGSTHHDLDKTAISNDNDPYHISNPSSATLGLDDRQPTFSHVRSPPAGSNSSPQIASDVSGGHDLREIIVSLGYSLTCPVCRSSLDFDDLAGMSPTSGPNPPRRCKSPDAVTELYSEILNRHLDECLNSQALSQMGGGAKNSTKLELPTQPLPAPNHMARGRDIPNDSKRKSGKTQESIVKFLKHT